MRKVWKGIQSGRWIMSLKDFFEIDSTMKNF